MVRSSHASCNKQYVYGAHFYVSMKGSAILRRPLGPHKLSNIMPPHWKLFVGGLWSRCEATARRTFAAGEGAIAYVEWLPNSDPVLSKWDQSFGLIESQLSQCKCIVILRTMSYSNGKQLVRSGMLLMQDR